MQFRRSGQRDERRRRVLLDETGAPLDGTTQRVAGERNSPRDGGAAQATVKKRYTNAALAKHQPRVTDLLPKRWWIFALWLVAALLTVAGLDFLHVKLTQWPAALNNEDFAAFDLAAQGSIAAWFASVVLLSSAIVSLHIFMLRRHKIDDYRGHYRLWIWTAAVFLFASIDAVAGLHRTISAAAIYLTGTTILDDGSVWWMMLSAVVLLPLTVCLTLEMRSCRTATAALITSAACYLFAALSFVGIVPALSEVTAVVERTNAALLAHVAALLSLTLFARYVYLDAHGILPVRKVRVRAARAKQAAETVPADETNDADPSSRRKKKSQPQREEVPVAEDDSADSKMDSSTRNNDRPPASLSRDDEDSIRHSSSSDNAGPDFEEVESEEPRKLSKAERRRLRKLQRRRTRDAA